MLRAGSLVRLKGIQSVERFVCRQGLQSIASLPLWGL